MKWFVTLVVAFGFSATVYGQSVSVGVVLNPMGDFKAKTTDIKGMAVVNGDEVSAENIVVNLKNLKTGVELRDKHTLKHLQVDKYPEAVLAVAKGKGGKGQGRIKIRGIEKNISGTYKISGKKLLAEFKLNLSDFKIEDISYMGVGVEDEVTLQVVIPIK